MSAQGIRKFRKNKRRFRRFAATFDGVIGVIAPNGENLAGTNRGKKLDVCFAKTSYGSSRAGLKSHERLQLFDSFRAAIDDVQRAVRFEQPIGDCGAAGSLGPRQLSYVAHDIAKQDTHARLVRVFRFELSQFHFRDLSMIAAQSTSVNWSFDWSGPIVTFK